MSERIGDGLLELEVTDFGPIVEAKVDLRPLTVSVGPNNAGKSYLAVLVYALHRVFGGDTHLAGRQFRSGFPHSLGRGSQDLSEGSVDALLERASSLASDSETRGPSSIVLPRPAADALRFGFDALEEALSGDALESAKLTHWSAGVGRAHRTS